MARPINGYCFILTPFANARSINAVDFNRSRLDRVCTQPVMYCSKAMVMDGALAVGALMSIRNPAASAAFAVVGPNTAMRVGPCSKSGSS